MINFTSELRNAMQAFRAKFRKQEFNSDFKIANSKKDQQINTINNTQLLP